jgi:L-malate glycosyltransferase
MEKFALMHLLGSHQLGGADRFFIRLVEALERAGHPALAVLRRDSPVARLLSPRIEQIHVPFASKWDLYTQWRVRQLIRSRRPAVVQTYMGRATRLTHVPPGCATAHVARLGGFYKIDGYYEHADAWVGNTRAICEHLKAHGLPPQRVVQIGNFVPTPREVTAAERAALRRRLGLPADAFVVFGLGRLLPKKGFADLLKAFARLPAAVEQRPLWLLVAGDGGDAPALKASARRLGIDARVCWAGWQDDPAPYFAQADLFVCPSRHEPLGNVILEAWQHRLPVVTTCNEGARELVTEGVDALLAPLQDPSGLARTLQQAIALGAEGRAELATAGHATVLREHGEASVVEAYLTLYRELAVRPAVHRTAA